MKELLPLHFLLQDIPFKIEAMLYLAKIQVDFELDFNRSFNLFNFLVKLQGLLLLNLMLEALFIDLLLFEILDSVYHFVLEGSELNGHTEVVPVLDAALLVGEFVEVAKLVATVLQVLVFDVFKISGDSSDVGSLSELFINLVSRLSGPKLDRDLRDLHVEVEVVHLFHVVLLVVLAIRVVRVEVCLQVLRLCLDRQLLINS